MAPPVSGSNPLKPNEEEWREVYTRLCERFPTVKPPRVAQALRDHGGHAGEAAAVLRDLTGSTVKEADPDDVEHVATLLSSPAMFKHACKEQFKKFDINKDGVLEWDEVKQLVNNLYDEFGLQEPAEGALRAFFYATDENQDGVLSEREFRKFFEMFLRYAFFDHLKLRQMVEKGQEIEQRRSLVSNGPIRVPAPERRNDAENVSPQDSRASSASDLNKPQKEGRVPTPDETQAPAPKPKLAPIDQPKPAGRRSPQERESKEKDNERRHHRRQEKERERERAPPPEASEGSFGTLRCVAPHGVAYRNSAAYQDRMDAACGRGETVRVLEHWVRTPDGWLPVTDQQGQTLLERCSADAPDGGNNQKKRVSIQEEKDTLDLSREQCSRNERERTPQSPPSTKAGGGGGGGLTAKEEEWRPIFDRLTERFPNISSDKIVQALRDNDGHAGKAASMLRYM